MTQDMRSVMINTHLSVRHTEFSTAELAKRGLLAILTHYLPCQSSFFKVYTHYEPLMEVTGTLRDCCGSRGVLLQLLISFCQSVSLYVRSNC